MTELIHQCQLKIAERYGVNLEDLHYIGFTDCSFFREEGSKVLQFNLLKEGHERHRSTVAWESWKL